MGNNFTWTALVSGSLPASDSARSLRRQWTYIKNKIKKQNKTSKQTKNKWRDANKFPE